MWHADGMTVTAELRLPSGLRAVIEPDRWADGSYTLVVDGTPQSHVDLDDPSRLFFEYVQRIGHVIDEWGDPGQPMTALHLGAGALTLPRYIHATRPGSRQQVIELDEALVAFVREHLPLPTQSGIRVRYGDARAMLARLPAALHGAVDLVVVDVFSGARIPAHVTSAEFYREVAAFLAPGGIIAVNVADGPGLAFARGQAATTWRHSPRRAYSRAAGSATSCSSPRPRRCPSTGCRASWRAGRTRPRSSPAGSSSTGSPVRPS